MIFSKKKMATAISATLMLGTPFVVKADPLTISATSTNTLSYTSSLTIDDDEGLDLTDPIDIETSVGTAQDIDGVLNANDTPTNVDLQVKFTLDGEALFIETPALAVIDDEGDEAPFSYYLGGAGYNWVTFSLSDAENTEQLAGPLDFDLDIMGVTVVDQGDVSISVDFDLADSFGVSDITEFTAPYIDFADTFDLSVDLEHQELDSIDVAQNSYFFDGAEGDTEVTLGHVHLSIDESTLAADSTEIVPSDLIGDVGLVLSSTNGLAAFDPTNEDDDVGIFHDGTPMVIDAEDDTSATLSLSGETAETSALTQIDSTYMVAVVDAENDVQIDATEFTLLLDGDAGEGYNDDDFNETLTLNPLAKNGSSARLTFALKPAGAYKMLVRLTNPSGIDGQVSVTLTNDTGDSVGFSLGDIENVDSDILEAGSSTGLVSIDELYAAAVAADSSFDNNDGKLRIDVDAAFGVTGATSGIVINAFTVASDGTSINMMTTVSD